MPIWLPASVLPLLARTFPEQAKYFKKMLFSAFDAGFSATKLRHCLATCIGTEHRFGLNRRCN